METQKGKGAGSASSPESRGESRKYSGNADHCNTPRGGFDLTGVEC